MRGNFKIVAILCEYDYIKSIIVVTNNAEEIKKLVAILCEYDYIKSSCLRSWSCAEFLRVAILCEYDYIKSVISILMNVILFVEVAILCEYDYIKSVIETRETTVFLVAILCEYDYIKSLVAAAFVLVSSFGSQYSASTIISNRRKEDGTIVAERWGRNTLRVRLYQINNSTRIK